MFKQVLGEAPWIDVIVRGEGESVTLNLGRAIDEGRWPNQRDEIKGIGFLGDDGTVVAPPAEPSIKDIGRRRDAAGLDDAVSNRCGRCPQATRGH